MMRLGLVFLIFSLTTFNEPDLSGRKRKLYQNIYFYRIERLKFGTPVHVSVDVERTKIAKPALILIQTCANAYRLVFESFTSQLGEGDGTFFNNFIRLV